MSAVRVLRSLHSQPKADVLLCVGPAEADQESPRELVVIKQLYLSGASSPTSVEITRLMETERMEAAKEVRVIHKLLTLPQHPYIVRYHSISYQQDSVRITMEYCSRGDLLTWLEQQPRKRFPEPQALAIFRQILSGVRFLHTHGIAHRDISLENCLVTQDYTIKICDFGLATSVTSPSREQVGKLNYMAPEVLRGDYYDPVKADVWSLGIVLFVLLTGPSLFQVAREGDVGFKCVQRIGIAGVLKQWNMQDQVSHQTTDLISAMLVINDADRLRSVEAILQRMEL